MLNALVPKRGYLQECRVPQDIPTPTYIDNMGTVRVGQNEGSCKKSLWAKRKVRVLNDGYEQGLADYIKVDEADNVSDGASTPVKHSVYMRHAAYMSGKWP